MRMHFVLTSAAVLVSTLATFMISHVEEIDWPKAQPTVVAGAHGAGTGNIDWP